MKRMMIIAFLFTVAAGMFSCSLAITPPDGYVELEDPPESYEYLAFSADNTRIAVSCEENSKNGTLEFWQKTFMNKFVINEGKKFVKEGDFNAKKQPGKFLVFETEKTGIAYMYIIGFLVKGDDVYILEAAGTKEKIEPDMDKIVASFSTLK